MQGEGCGVEDLCFGVRFRRLQDPCFSLGYEGLGDRGVEAEAEGPERLVLALRDG